MCIEYDSFNSPIGEIYIVADDIGVRRVELFKDNWQKYIKENPYIKKGGELCKRAVEELKEYFNGNREEFDLPLSLEGTEFRKSVWKALRDIPYGEVRSYLDVAQEIGNEKAVRAVGQANKSNPLPIIIPCHRVIGKKGNLVGFAGDNIDVQKKLLQIEGVVV